ncbi:MAG: DUF4432 family protein [Ruminococcaceae bacterium]|nr:DUF4432 family protein [Oscillospiraceae bacterium]
MKDYISNPLQIRGAEKYTLCDGKGNGMNFLYIRNGLGLEAWVSLDRAGDISRVSFKGDNMGYHSAAGYVAPAYFNKNDFLASFNAGFFTTCGLTAVGSPCIDDGEELSLHGTVSNIPSILNAVEETDDGLAVRLTVRDASLGGRKLVLRREYLFSYTENKISLKDTVTNEGANESPFMILYHCNMGYPLLNENSEVVIPHTSIKGRDEHAAEHIDTALKMEKPQANYQERCYYFDIPEKDGLANAGIYNKDIERGVVVSFDKSTLPFFTEWKMMGKGDYVLGLEPGNCTPDGRDVMRKNGTLQFIRPDKSITTKVSFSFCDSKDSFDGNF